MLVQLAESFKLKSLFNMEDYRDDPFDGKTRAECWYADIFHMTYQHTKHEPHLSMRQRAAQFASFAALSGFK